MVTAQSAHVTPRFIGEPHVQLFDVESATVIYAGSFVCQKNGDAHYVTPASSVADAGDAAANREAAADLFIGVALDGSASGDTDEIRVAVAPTQLYLKQYTAAATTVGATQELYGDATCCADDTIVAGSTSQVATCIKQKPSTIDPWVACELIRPAIISSEEQS